MLTILVFFVTFFLLVCFMLRRNALKDRAHFENQGVMYLGNRSYSLLFETLMGITIETNQQRWYTEMVREGQKIAGSREFGANVININDPELIKHITIKDFDYFINRREFEMPKEEVLFGKMLFSLRGETWRNFRTAISPAFTSSKVKRLYPLFIKSGQAMVKYLAAFSGQEINFIDIIPKFTIDVISTAVCGIESNSFELEEPSMMEKMSRRMELDFGGLQVLKLLLIMCFPAVGNLFKMSFFDKEAEDFFMHAITQTIKTREANPGQKQDDFVQLMLEGRKKKDDDENQSAEYLDDVHIVANCVLFILAGHATTHIGIIFALYALATHPEIQDRLRREIEESLKKEDVKTDKGQFLSYDGLHALKYMDMVINETLRLYPPTTAFDRGCTKAYTIPGTNFTLKKGQGVLLPVFSLQRDERFWPNPLKFDPERFSEENKHTINPYAYIPFGAGNRQCIGMRFSSSEVKLAIAMLVYYFKLEPSANTTIPMEFTNANTLKPKYGMKLNITMIPRS